MSGVCGYMFSTLIAIIVLSLVLSSTFIYFLHQARLFILQCPHNILYYLSLRRQDQKKNHSSLPPAALIIISHPDDECMFFGPVIRTLIKQGGFRVHLLCLSSGSSSPSISFTRKRELQLSCQKLGISKVKVIDDQMNLKDGLKENWDANVIVSHISLFIEELAAGAPFSSNSNSNSNGSSSSSSNNSNARQVDTLITFDKNGISGHPNHIAVHKATRTFAASSDREFRLWELESIPLLVKYSGIASLILDATLIMLDLMFNGFDKDKEIRLICTVDPEETERIKRAMREHKSQLVWYRKLYILFSRYFHTNTLIFKKPIVMMASNDNDDPSFSLSPLIEDK